MPGQCYSCRAHFGIFKKEHGCKNCGFAFCSKCLHEKSIAVPKRDNTKHHVCVKCYKILSGEGGKETRPVQYDVPQAFAKRVAALKDKEGDGAVAKPQSKAQPQKIPAHLQKLDKADRDIAMRLERLRESDKPKEKVSDADLTSRLANLKGERNIPDQKPVYHPPDRRTQFEQVDDLLNEIADEVEIDSHAPDPVKDIESRLAHLRYGEGGADQKNAKTESGHGTTNVLPSSSSKHNTGPSVPASSSGDGDQVNMEEMQRLMEATAKELEIDAQRALDGMKKDKELMERLAEIQKRKDAKGADGEQTDEDQSEASARKVARDLKMDANDDDDSDHSSESEDACARRLIQQYLEEAKIDDKVTDSQTPPQSTNGEKKKQKSCTKGSETKSKPAGDSNVDSDYDDNDELPYCCICTEDAVMRCRDCGLDLYCQRCFRECHQEIGLTDHETTPYKAPKGYR